MNLVISNATMTESMDALVDQKNEISVLLNEFYVEVSELGPPSLIKKAERLWFAYGSMEDQIDLVNHISSQLNK